MWLRDDVYLGRARNILSIKHPGSPGRKMMRRMGKGQLLIPNLFKTPLVFLLRIYLALRYSKFEPLQSRFSPSPPRSIASSSPPVGLV